MNTAGIAAKKQTTRKLLREIIENPNISRSELAGRFALSPATVTIAINELLEKGLVIEGRIEQTPVGRKAKLLQLNDQLYSILAVNITEDAQIELRLCDLSSAGLAAAVVPIPKMAATAVSEILAFFRDTLLNFLAAAPKAWVEKLLGAAVIVPGLIRSDNTADLPLFGWKQLPLSDVLSRALGVPVFTDTSIRILGSYELQFFRKQQHVLYLSLDPGVGLAYFENGRLQMGQNRLFGEVGHISLNEDGPVCYCGNHGCFEYYCGLPGILSRLQALVRAGSCPILTALAAERGNVMSLSLAMAAYRRGSAAARALIDEVADYLGRALVTICNLLDPDQIVLSGTLLQENYILQTALSFARSRILARNLVMPVFSRAYLSAREYEMGVCHYVLGGMLEELLA